MDYFVMTTSLSRTLIGALASGLALISASSNASAELLTTWAGSPIGECLSGNTISIPGETVCLRRLSDSEVSEYKYYTRLSALKKLERKAERSVQRGYDPSVSLSDFRRRLDRRSEIRSAILDMKY